MSIRILRSQTTATPPSLDEGQLAYSENSGNLFIGVAGAGVQKIGGKSIVDAVDTNFNTNVDARIALADLADLLNVNATVPSDTQVLTWDQANGYWKPAAPGTGVTSFVALNDTPANYVGSGGFHVKVNAGATALEFTEDIDDGTF